MSKKYTLEEVRHIAKTKGFELISDVYVNSLTRLILKDCFGYLYETTLINFYYKNNKLLKFHKNNPYVMQNIELWLYKHFPEFNILEKDYRGTKYKYTLFTQEGYKCITNLDILQRGFTPAIFINSNPYTIHNIRLWCKLNNKSFELLSIIYKGNDKKLQWKCLNNNCGEIFESNWDSIFSGRGCGYCSGKQVGLSNCLATKNIKISSLWHPTKNNNLTPYDFTVGSSKKAWWLCKECGYEWDSSIIDRTARNAGCPVCMSKSRGEDKIKIILTRYNIIHKHQYKIKGCKNIFELPFDFYLPYYNICIEYQGIQHYEPVDHFGGVEQFKLQQINDQIKRDYCKANNIKLIEIPYWDFNNIEEILMKELNINIVNNSENAVVFI